MRVRHILTLLVLEGGLATILATPNFGNVLRLLGAQAVLESRTTASEYPAEGYGHDTPLPGLLHSSTAALGTHLSCGRYLKKSQNKKQFQNLYFPRRPHDLSVYGSTAPTRCSVVLKNHTLLSFEQSASSATLFGVL